MTTDSEESVSIVRYNMNQAINRFFELGKKYISKRLLQKQDELSLPEGLRGIIEIGQRANLNTLVYFRKVFTVLEKTANEILKENYEPNKEVVSLSSSINRAKDLQDIYKIEFKEDEWTKANSLGIEELEDAMKEDIKSMCRKMALFVGDEKVPNDFTVNIRGIIGNLYFLVSFRRKFMSKKAAEELDWLHSMEELERHGDQTIVSAFYERARKEEQSELVSF